MQRRYCALHQLVHCTNFNEFSNFTSPRGQKNAKRNDGHHEKIQ
jgi:hypothetical protein